MGRLVQITFASAQELKRDFTRFARDRQLKVTLSPRVFLREVREHRSAARRGAFGMVLRRPRGREYGHLQASPGPRYHAPSVGRRALRFDHSPSALASASSVR